MWSGVTFYVWTNHCFYKILTNQNQIFKQKWLIKLFLVLTAEVLFVPAVLNPKWLCFLHSLQHKWISNNAIWTKKRKLFIFILEISAKARTHTVSPCDFRSSNQSLKKRPYLKSEMQEEFTADHDLCLCFFFLQLIEICSCSNYSYHSWEWLTFQRLVDRNVDGNLEFHRKLDDLPCALTLSKTASMFLFVSCGRHHIFSHSLMSTGSALKDNRRWREGRQLNADDAHCLNNQCGTFRAILPDSSPRNISACFQEAAVR